ncbi:MAG: NmrA family NAD(P)-binding protein [Steroidobacteraceae bacterium]|nr:NmrA family NAD(P)-binding protein [Steroidobacteraceae bacterium]
MNSAAGVALVLGASGDQGFPQAVQLAGNGWRVRAAARALDRLHSALDNACAPAVRGRIVGVEVDLADANSLSRAMTGVDVLLANYPSSSLHDAGALIAAAEATGAAAARAGVSLIVLNTSLPLPTASLGFAAQDVRMKQREILRDSGVPTISIQPVVFMDNLLRGWTYPEILAKDCLPYAHAPTLEVAWICLHDLAQLMEAAATRPHLAGRDINVGGPELLRGPDLARILSELTGRQIAFSSEAVETFCMRMREAFVASATIDADRLVEELGRIYRWYNESAERPFRIDMRPVLRDLPVTLTTFATWASRQRWNP